MEPRGSPLRAGSLPATSGPRDSVGAAQTRAAPTPVRKGRGVPRYPGLPFPPSVALVVRGHTWRAGLAAHTSSRAEAP